MHRLLYAAGDVAGKHFVQALADAAEHVQLEGLGKGVVGGYQGKAIIVVEGKHRNGGADGIERRLDVGMGTLCEHATSMADNVLIFSIVRPFLILVPQAEGTPCHWVGGDEPRQMDWLGAIGWTLLAGIRKRAGRHGQSYHSKLARSAS